MDEFGPGKGSHAASSEARAADVLALNAASDSPTYACLCCACGTISLERDWTYWQQADDEAPDWDGENWRPSLDGESDPMMLCPACGWEHRDTDDGSGVYMGTLAEMEAQREADLPESREWWAGRIAEVNGLA